MSEQPSRVVRMPSRTHEARRVLLRTVAEVGGYQLKVALPDGTRPDVLRLHARRRGVFLGEAKHTEGTCDSNSIDRLRKFLGWVVPFNQWDVMWSARRRRRLRGSRSGGVAGRPIRVYGQ